MELITPGLNLSSLIIILAIIILLLTIIALIRIINSSGDDNQRAIWAIVVLGVPLLGPLLYFILGSSNEHR